MRVFLVTCVQPHPVYVHAILDIKTMYKSPPQQTILGELAHDIIIRPLTKRPAFDKAKWFMAVCTRYIKTFMNAQHIKLFVVGS